MLILADDLTGAMDAAAPFQRQGAETVVDYALRFKRELD